MLTLAGLSGLFRDWRCVLCLRKHIRLFVYPEKVTNPAWPFLPLRLAVPKVNWMCGPIYLAYLLSWNTNLRLLLLKALPSFYVSWEQSIAHKRDETKRLNIAKNERLISLCQLCSRLIRPLWGRIKSPLERTMTTRYFWQKETEEICYKFSSAKKTSP